MSIEQIVQEILTELEAGNVYVGEFGEEVIRNTITRIILGDSDADCYPPRRYPNF